MENTLKSILKTLDLLVTYQKDSKAIQETEALFFELIEEACNVRGPEDIENFIDAYSDDFHNLFERVGKKLNWSFNY